MTIDVEQLRRRMSVGAVVVLGAGMSLQARYPDTFGLNGLLWDSLDADLAARAGLARRLNVRDEPAKALVGDDFSKWNEAWLSVATSPSARKRFQHGFANLDSNRASRPSASHEALARLVHSGEVELVISFNWDSALERSYERTYGVEIPAGTIQKPHGDVAQPDDPWVLPHEEGFVGQELLRQLAELADEYPRTLLVVGYSESDRAVVDNLIAPLDKRWRTCRVGPNVTGADDVVGTADEVLGALANPLAQREDRCVWKIVTFANQRGIEAALEGRRLSAVDVAACPPLPEVDLVTEALLRTFAVVINGASGSGKSITAYQVANRLRQRGYEVLRLRDRGKSRSVHEWTTDLALFAGPKVLFVDDAQDLGSDEIEELAEVANARTLVLIAGVDHIAGGVATFTLTGTGAVATLERYVIEHAVDLLPKVHELDDWVGNGFADVPLGTRAQEAARESTAWQFFYTLTGGWRRTARILHEVRSCDRADILACALSIAQIATVDSGVTVDDLVPYATTVGRDREWIERNLGVLQQRRLAVEDDRYWRTTHLRTAYAVLNAMLHPPTWESPPNRTVIVPPIASANGSLKAVPAATPPKRKQSQRPLVAADVVESDRETAAALLTCAVNAPTTPLRGLAWLLGRNLSTQAGWIIRRHGVRSPEIDKVLAERALATPPGAEVGTAAQLLDELHGPDTPIITKTIWEHIDAVIAWVEALTPPNGWAVANLINVLHNDNKDALAAAIDGVDPTAVAGLIEAGGWPHIYSSVRAVDRIAQGGGLQFLMSVSEAIDEPTLDRMLDEVPDLHGAGVLLGGLAFLNPVVGIRLFEKHAVQLAAMFSPNPLDRFHDLFETFAFLLRAFSLFDTRSKPPTAARRAIRAFLRALETGPLTSALEQPREDSRWHNFEMFLVAFADAASKEWAQVVKDIDLERLERSFAEQLPHPGEHLLFVMYMVAQVRRDEVLSLLARHEDRFGAIHRYLVHTHPELSVRLVEQGLPMDLGLYDQRYEAAAEMIDLVSAQKPQVAREVIVANSEAFCDGLARNFQPAFTDLSKWVTAVDRWAPGHLDEILARLPEETISCWTSALRKRQSKREIGPLIARAAATGHAHAAEVMKKFPSLASIPVES